MKTTANTRISNETIEKALNCGALLIGITPGLSYDKHFKVFNLSADLPYFDRYVIINTKTGKVRRFELVEENVGAQKLDIYKDTTVKGSGLEIHRANA